MCGQCLDTVWWREKGVTVAYKFKLAVATGLIETTVAPHHERVPAPAPPETQHNRDVSHDSRYDGVGHLVKQLDAKVQRCKLGGLHAVAGQSLSASNVEHICV